MCLRSCRVLSLRASVARNGKGTQRRQKSRAVNVGGRREIWKRIGKVTRGSVLAFYFWRFIFGDGHEIEGRNLLACAGRTLSGEPEPAVGVCSGKGQEREPRLLDARSHRGHAVVPYWLTAIERWVYLLRSIGPGCVERLESISRSRAVCRSE